MKVHERSNIVPLSTRERPRERQGDRSGAQGERRSPELLQNVREQLSQLETAIREVETARSTISESACSAAKALHRFEQTLANLRISLENQRFAADSIDSASRAGHAAAWLKAQILDSGDLAVMCHGNALPQQITRVLHEPE
jgi:hypothetical protein